MNSLINKKIDAKLGLDVEIALVHRETRIRLCDYCKKDVEGLVKTCGPVVCYICKKKNQKERQLKKRAKLKKTKK